MPHQTTQAREKAVKTEIWSGRQRVDMPNLVRRNEFVLQKIEALASGSSGGAATGSVGTDAGRNPSRVASTTKSEKTK
jgi:hypothetical protein